MTTVEAFAPAKINLALHVTGQRDDGYHELDSLVAFAHVGDTVQVEHSDELSLVMDGPFARDVAADGDNLVLRAARLVGGNRGAKITLTKRLPVSSGIGGGSADAAATVRALCRLWDLPWPDAARLASLGADVPVCLRSGLTRMRGIGDRLDILGPTPEMGLLLVNPGIAVPTSTVFQALASKSNAPMAEPAVMPTSARSAFTNRIDWLASQRNDLEEPAIRHFPVIGEVLAELGQIDGCRLARMSGSGATCFAVFEDAAFVHDGGIRGRHPDWWVAETAGCPFVFDMEAPDGYRTA